MNRITRGLTAGVTGLGLAIGGVAVGAPAAVAAKPTPYVTKAEYNKVGKGMTIKRVHGIFGVAGKRWFYDRAYPAIGLPAVQSRDYRVKDPLGWVTVDYENVNGTWKLTGKSANWGPEATPNYVSRVEFQKVGKGMTMKKVHGIFDIPGKQTSYDSGLPGKYGYPATQSRDYKVKSKWGWVTVDYKFASGAWKVTSKSAYWG